MEKLMSIKELAEYLNMNKMTVYKLAREGKLPAFKVASEWRFRRDLVDKWLMGQLKSKAESGISAGMKKDRSDYRILVVDDEAELREFFKQALKEYIVETASDGYKALEIIEKNKPDLVLLDLRMPGINGVETLRRIKQIDNNIAVIILSAFTTVEDNIEAARLGAYTSMVKPFDLKEMKSIINKALSG